MRSPLLANSRSMSKLYAAACLPGEAWSCRGSSEVDVSFRKFACEADTAETMSSIVVRWETNAVNCMLIQRAFNCSTSQQLLSAQARIQHVTSHCHSLLPPSVTQQSWPAVKNSVGLGDCIVCESSTCCSRAPSPLMNDACSPTGAVSCAAAGHAVEPASW